MEGDRYVTLPPLRSGNQRREFRSAYLEAYAEVQGVGEFSLGFFVGDGVAFFGGAFGDGAGDL